MSKSKFIMLGTGTPNCTAGRAQQSSAVIVANRAYLIDCGAGTILRATQAGANGVPGFNLKELARVFLTHLHPDHCTGLAALIISPWVKDRTEPLHVYGPAGTRDMVNHLLTAYKIGIHEHANGLAPLDDTGLAVVHEYDEGLIYEDEFVSILDLAAPHCRNG